VRGGDFRWPQAGTFRGHQRGPHLAASGYSLMATDIGHAIGRIGQAPSSNRAPSGAIRGTSGGVGLSSPLRPNLPLHGTAPRVVAGHVGRPGVDPTWRRIWVASPLAAAASRPRPIPAVTEGRFAGTVPRSFLSGPARPARWFLWSAMTTAGPRSRTIVAALPIRLRADANMRSTD